MIKKKFPLITVITPAYNREHLIVETIESVLNQSYPNIEYIVLDDGSSDHTLQEIKKFKKYIVIESHQNVGEAETVNLGFKMANGKYIVVVNSDDPLYPDAISKMVDFMENNPKLAVGYPDWDYIDEKGNVSGSVKVPEYNFYYMLSSHKCLPGPGAIFKKTVVEAVGGRNPDYKYVGDFDFWLRAGIKFDFARIPHKLATFRIHSDSLSVNKEPKMAREDIMLLDNFYQNTSLSRKICRLKAKSYSSAMIHAAQICGSKGLSRSLILKALLRYPLNFFCISNCRLFLRLMFYGS